MMLYYNTDKNPQRRIRKGEVFCDNFSAALREAQENKENIYVFEADRELIDVAFQREQEDRYRVLCHVSLNCCQCLALQQ